MAKKRSKVRVVRPRKGRMWIESLEKRELMAASDTLLTPFESSPGPSRDGHALSARQEEPFSGVVNTESQGKTRNNESKSRGDDSVVVIIL